jgi:hypothetical protein
MKKVKFLFVAIMLSQFSLSANAQFGGAILQGVLQGLGNVINSPSKTAAPKDVEPEKVAQPVEEPTRLQLRAIQTRKFNKPPQQVVDSIKELSKDKGWSCLAWYAPSYRCDGVMKMNRDQNSRTCFAPDGVSPGNMVKNTVMDQTSNRCYTNKGNQVSFEFDTNYPKSDETILRIRINRPGTGPLVNPEMYNLLFKEIADGLFIDAIEINPALQE